MPDLCKTFCTPDVWPRPLSDRKVARIESRLKEIATQGGLCGKLRVLDSRVTVYQVRRELWPPSRWCSWQAEPRDETIGLWPAAVRAFTYGGCERRAVREYERRVRRG